MMFKVVLFMLSVLCVVNSQSEAGCGHSRSYTRIKRGKYPGPPLRFYSRPPASFPIKGPFSYTPPPFMVDDEPLFPGSRPYKVSKRPTNEGLGDEDINNLVKNLSKQDLDKILEFAYEKEKFYDKNKVADYNQPHKRENPYRPPYTKEFYRGNTDDDNYEMVFKKYVNYVTAATPVETLQDDRRSSFPKDDEINKVKVYGIQNEIPDEYTVFRMQDDQRFPAPTTNNNINNPQAQNIYLNPTNLPIIDSNDEETLPPPINMREEEYDVSYTNNVPTVVKADSSSYQLENFGDLPLMNYNSKLHSVSSYHVPHYTVTQSKPQSGAASSSSSLLKSSPAAASIKIPPVEPAPPISAAKQQSDAHLKATQIWTHRSKGVAYTLHDDGTLTPERPRPNYG